VYADLKGKDKFIAGDCIQYCVPLKMPWLFVAAFKATKCQQFFFQKVRQFAKRIFLICQSAIYIFAVVNYDACQQIDRARTPFHNTQTCTPYPELYCRRGEIFILYLIYQNHCL